MANFKYTGKKIIDGKPVGEAVLGTKLTAKEVEKVLTAHNLKQLRIHGSTWHPLEDVDWLIGTDHKYDPQGCIMQVVNNNPDSVKAYDQNPAVAAWFDQNYNPEWTVDEFLEAMRSAQVTNA